VTIGGGHVGRDFRRAHGFSPGFVAGNFAFGTQLNPSGYYPIYPWGWGSGWGVNLSGGSHKFRYNLNLGGSSGSSSYSGSSGWGW